MSTHEQITMKSAATTGPAHLTPAAFRTLQRQCTCGGTTGAGEGCEACNKKKNTLQRHVLTGTEPATVPPIVHDVLRSPGQPLDAATRAFMEPRFGHDFSRVRVHADVYAAQSAAAINARAYALGSQVVFGGGEYSPSTERGRNLLAHELAHVVQQSSSANEQPSDLRVGAPGDAAEQEADRFAEAVTHSQSVDSVRGSRLLENDEEGRGFKTDDYLSAGRPTDGWERASNATRNERGAIMGDHIFQSAIANRQAIPDAPRPFGPFQARRADRSPAMLRRTITVNPPAAAADILRQFNVLCPGNFAVSGQNITETCSASTNQSCDCLCDVAHDPSRSYTINVQTAAAGTESKALYDGSTQTVPSISVWPQTAPGTNPTVTVVASGSPVEFGSFAPDGHAEWAEDWRVLEHELCGHARLGGGDGPIGNRPLHDATIDTENAIAAEHGRPARGHFTDRRQGESFFNPAGNRSKVKFVLKDGHHFEAP